MTRAYNVVDADGHILEPLDLWDKYIDPKFRDRAPRIVKDNESGKERLVIEEHTVGNPQIGIGRIGAVGARQGVVAADTMEYKEGKPGGFDPHKRIPDMDADGIDAAFLYPSLGLFSGAIHDPQLAAAVCRAYNRWLADYCKPYPDRLFGVAMLPLQEVELAVAEMRYARKELGMKGAFIRPNPYHGTTMINDPMYEKFWAAAEDLDMSIGFHEGGSSGMPTVGIDRFEGRAARHIVSHTMEMMLAALAVIWGGVCEKHPKIRIGFLESGGGWIAPENRPRLGYRKAASMPSASMSGMRLCGSNPPGRPSSYFISADFTAPWRAPTPPIPPMPCWLPSS
jgi:predicted TIM-barrel fold metal-dependent hydrolase